jgi:HEAT repeat protein
MTMRGVTLAEDITMPRPTALLIVLPLMFVNAACLNSQDPEESERWGDRQWRDAVRENEQRLKSEDERGRGALSGVSGLTEGFGQLIDNLTGKKPMNAAKNLLDPADADRRREAIVYLADRPYGRQDPYTDYYEELARTDNDYLVRAMAVRALNRARDEAATPVFIAALEDQHPLVRLEAAKALANVPDEKAVAPLIKRLDNPEETPDVRIAAADALRNYRTAPAAQALVRVLRDRDFAVSWQARRGLKLMTGRDYRYDQGAWLTYLSEGAPFG